jgi:hypothetical protein
MFNSSFILDFNFLLSYVALKSFSLILRRHNYLWRVAKFRPMLGAQGLWAGRDLYRATPAVTRGLGFSGLIRRTAPFSHLLRHTSGCGGSILTWILTVSYQSPFTTRKGMWRTYSNPDPNGAFVLEKYPWTWQIASIEYSRPTLFLLIHIYCFCKNGFKSNHEI